MASSSSPVDRVHVATPEKSKAGKEQQDDSISVVDLMRNLALAPGKGSPGSPNIEQHSTRRYSVLDINLTYATSSQQSPSTKTETVEKSQEDKPEKDIASGAKASEEQPKFTTITPSKPIVSPSRKSLSPEVEQFAKRLLEAKNVVVMVGAGLSVAAGIPDFRTPGTGLYSQLAKYKLPKPEAVFEINYFTRNPEPFRQLASELWPGRKYLPTTGHYFVKLLHDQGKLLRCYTQNIDSLETMTGLPKEKIVAAHGNFDSATCVFTKKKIANMDEVRDAYLNNTHDALNKKYGTRLVKPDIVFFGESLPARFHQLVPVDFDKADLLIVMGTSLQVHPFASLITMTRRGVPRMLINRERVGEFYPRGFNFKSANMTDVFLKGDCDDGCMAMAEALGWESELLDLTKPRL